MGWTLRMVRTLAVIGTLGGVTSPAASFPLRWRWSNPRPHGNNIVDMSYSALAGLGVQVAERGQIYTSTDLESWVPRESGTTRSLRGVCFFGSRILITGEEGTVLYADTPEQFLAGTLVSGTTTDWLESVAASATLAVAVGDNAAVYVSTDGVAWRRLTSGVPTTQWLRSVAFGSSSTIGSRFVAVGDAGTILSSVNGTNWTLRSTGITPPPDLNRVSFGDNQFTAVGSGGMVLRSSNGGTNWVRRFSGATNDLFAVTTGGTDLLVAGDNEVRLFEGVYWTNELARAMGPPPWTYFAAIGRPGFFLLAGRTGMLIEGYQELVEPYLWVPSALSSRSWLFDLVWMTNLFVAVGDQGAVLTSGNGVDWSKEIVPASVSTNVLLGVGGTTNLLVAAGSQGALMISPQAYTNLVVTNADGSISNRLVSTLGVVWHDVQPRPVTNDLQGVTWWRGLYVVCGGGGALVTSPDGTNWTVRPTPTSALLSSVAGSAERLVACGDKGVLVASTNAVDWVAVPVSTTNWIYRVRWFPGGFVAVGQNGLILTSPDGLGWTLQGSPVQEWLNDVTLLEGTWFAVGTQGTVLVSTHASAWTNVGTITRKSLYSAAVDDHQLVTVGVEGAILRSPLVPDLSPVEILDYSRSLATNTATMQEIFLFAGKVDQRFTLDRRGGFDTNVWLTGPTLEFLDGSGTLYYLQGSPVTNMPPSQFYRGTLLP